MANSILETFYFLFKSDSKQVEEGAKKAKEPVKKLHQELASVDGIAKQAGEHVTDFFKEAAGAFLAFLTIGSVYEKIKETAEFADKLGKLSQQTGVNIEELSAWGDAVKVSGGSAESFQGTVVRLTASLSDFATKGRSRTAPFFQALGIHMVDAHRHARSVLDLLPELADAFQKIGKQESLGMGEKLGLDEGTILMLQKGRKYVEEMLKEQKELGVVTKELADISEVYNDQVDNTHHAFRTLYGVLAIDILPILTEMYLVFQNVAVYFRKHAQLIEGGIIAIAIALATYLVPALIEAVVAFSPFLLIGAGIAILIAAFALLYEDVKKFQEGNKSALGEIVKKYPEVAQVLHGLHNIVRQIIESFRLLGYVGVEIMDWLIGTISKAYNEILSIIGSVEGAVHKIKSLFGGEGHTLTVKDMMKNAQDQINFATNLPIGAHTANSVSNLNRSAHRSTTVQTGPITINTQTTNPDEISKSIGTHLQVQIQQAVSSFDDGVAA